MTKESDRERNLTSTSDLHMYTNVCTQRERHTHEHTRDDSHHTHVKKRCCMFLSIVSEMKPRFQKPLGCYPVAHRLQFLLRKVTKPTDTASKALSSIFLCDAMILRFKTATVCEHRDGPLPEVHTPSICVF